jgi:uroporphyrinogen-III decarboxylase
MRESLASFRGGMPGLAAACRDGGGAVRRAAWKPACIGRKAMTKVADVLGYLEDGLDAPHIERTKKNIQKALRFEDLDAVPLEVSYPCEKFEGYSVKETFEDLEKMMVAQLLPLCRLVETKDATIPMIRANYGVGILPSLFGLECTILENNLPWVSHLASTDKVKSLVGKGIPNLRSGYGGKVFDTHEYFYGQLSKYPKCAAAIQVYHPDLQGPFDVAHLIWGADIYYAIYDEPELVHELMGLVSDTYIAFLKALKQNIADEAGDFVYHWMTMYRGKLLIRNDSATNLSKEMYEEFVRPYDEKLLSAFGGGSIHFCGRGEQWIYSMLESKGLGALNFGQPPNMSFAFEYLGKIYPKAAEGKIAIVSYHMDKDLVKDIAGSEFKTGVTFSTGVSCKEEAAALLGAYAGM